MTGYNAVQKLVADFDSGTYRIVNCRFVSPEETLELWGVNNPKEESELLEKLESGNGCVVVPRSFAHHRRY